MKELEEETVSNGFSRSRQNGSLSGGFIGNTSLKAKC
jgi:hypothetical protein